MREIKFRAWDSVQERMRPFQDIHDVEILPDGTLRHMWPKCFLMQFTGVRDANGKEIYEGDIVRDPDIEFAREVYWDDEMNGFGTRHKNYYTPIGDGDEVIGDVFRDPGLMEV